MVATPRAAIAAVPLALVLLFPAVGCQGRAARTNEGPPGGAEPGSEAPPAEPPGGPGAKPPPSTPGTTGTPPVAGSGPPAIQFIGRFDEREKGRPKCGWPACRIIAVFDGSDVSVRLSEESLNAGPSEWDVAIDDEWQAESLVLAEGPRDYVLATNLPRGTHKVELYKRTEGQNGVTQFLGYDFHGGTLLPPRLRRERKLEIIGDSDVSGFGYQGSVTGTCLPGPVWAAHLENFRQAWGERLATSLHAELNATVFSGKGFYFNIWRPDTETIGVLYPRANPVDSTSVFDLNKFTPDVVVVSIGGNDYNLGQPEDFGAAPLAGFTDKARELTMMLRAHYPQAHVFLMAYAVLTDEYPPGRGRRTNVVTALQMVTNERNAAGDKRVYYVAPAPSTEQELTACDGHGGAAYHARIAAYMAAQISARTGWK